MHDNVRANELDKGHDKRGSQFIVLALVSRLTWLLYSSLQLLHVIRFNVSANLRHATHITVHINLSYVPDSVRRCADTEGRRRLGSSVTDMLVVTPCVLSGSVSELEWCTSVCYVLDHIPTATDDRLLSTVEVEFN